MKIQIYVYLVRQHWGLGLTPADAITACVAAGGKRLTDPTKCAMFRVPPGVGEVWVNEIGGVCWKFPPVLVPDEGPDLPEELCRAVKLFWDAETKTWKED